MVGKRRLDLAELDAKPADLDLMVGAAEELQRAAVPPANEVARAVHAAARRAERIGDEALRRERGMVEIAARKTRAGDMELARDADRYGLQPVVEDIDAGIVDGPADRRHGSAGKRHAQCGANRRLGRPVGVDHPAAGRPASNEIRRAGIAADDQRGELLESAGWHGGERGRRNEGVADLVADQRPRQVIAEQRPRRRDHERRPYGKGHEHVHDRGIEASRAELEDAGLRRDGEALHLRHDEARDAEMRDDDAFQPAGRAGRVDDVGGVFRRERGGPLGIAGIAVGVAAERRDGAGVIEDEVGRLPGSFAASAAVVSRRAGLASASMEAMRSLG
jgi:hypothetical protein